MARLKPNIPPHWFPRPKSSEQHQTNARKDLNGPTNKTTSQGTKAKRKFSETESDEYGGNSEMTAAFDEFHNIDEFENGAASTINGAKSKKQRKATAGLESSDAQEPRQLDNGKWECSHKCPDKSACKHPCCNKGLAKKPRPKAPKPDADVSAGVKQTQLNLPVRKKTKPSAQTSSTQAQRTELVATSESSKASEMGRANPAYGYLPSDPLNMDFGCAGRPALSKSGHNTSRFAQAARNAEQHMSSDGFDALDLTGSHEAQSGLFESEYDIAASSNHEGSLKRPKMIQPFQRDPVLSPSGFSGFNMDKHLDFSDTGPSTMGINAPASAKKPKRSPRGAEGPQVGAVGKTSMPFAEESSDSIAVNFGGYEEPNDSRRNHSAVNVPEMSICEAPARGEVRATEHSTNATGAFDGATQDSGTGSEMLMDWLGTDIFNFVD